MTAFKLVVIDPFENYKRGDQIMDQKLINNILDPESEIHHYERHTRRVLMSEIEKQQYVAPISENKAPESVTPISDSVEASLNIESIAE
jgi:hypothetical protein